MDKLVTGIITTYKREIRIVKRALESILAQSYRTLEVIVVDDNREDEASLKLSRAIADMVEDLAKTTDISIRVIKTENGKHGAQAARNTGIHNAKGSYLAFLDDDDEWLPEKIEKQMKLLEKRSDAGMCFTRGYRINEAFNPPYINDFQGDAFKSEVSYIELLRGDCIGTTTQALIPKTTFEKVGEFDEKLPARQDYEMWIRIASQFPIVGVDEPLFNYYKNGVGEQITHNWDKCIEGHTILYNKYKKDIDADRGAKFNVIFYLAHYYMCKGDKINMIKYYVKAFFIKPGEFWNKGVLKLKAMKKNAELKKSSGK